MEWNISNIKSIAIIGLILYIVLLQECHRRSSPDVEIIKSDTTSITVIDTIPFNDTVLHKINIEVPKHIIIYDTTKINEVVTVIQDTSDTTVYTYLQNIEDSLISGLLETKVQGHLLENDFSYTPKFPKYVYRIDTVKINTLVKVPERKFKVSVGAEIGGSPTSFNVSPLVSLNTGTGFTYSYRYGVLDKTHNVGITKIIKLKK